MITTDVTPSSTFIIRSKGLVRQEDGTSAYMSIILDKDANFLEAQKES